MAGLKIKKEEGDRVGGQAAPVFTRLRDGGGLGDSRSKRCWRSCCVGEARGGSAAQCCDCCGGSSERGMQTAWIVLLLSWVGSPEAAWTPPGHGDLLEATVWEGLAAFNGEQ